MSILPRRPTLWSSTSGRRSNGWRRTWRPWVPLLGILLGVELPDTPETAALDERFLRDRLSEVGLGFLGRLLEGTPTIFIIEDAQHLDDASRDLLLRLSKAAQGRRQLLLVTREGDRAVFASEDVEGTSATTVDLQPLTASQAAAILESATEDDPLHPHVVDELARRCGGNPLFLFQLLEAFRETGSLNALPGSIESLIAGEIDRLAPTDRTILRYAAVLGTSFDPALLTDCVRDDVELDPEVWTRLVRPAGRGVGRRAALPKHADAGRRVRGAPVSSTPSVARPRGRDDRVDRGRQPGRGRRRSWPCTSTRHSAGTRPGLRRGRPAIVLCRSTPTWRPALLRDGPHSGPAPPLGERTDLSKCYERPATRSINLGEYGGADHALLAARRAVQRGPDRAGELDRQAGSHLDAT